VPWWALRLSLHMLPVRRKTELTSMMRAFTTYNRRKFALSAKCLLFLFAKFTTFMRVGPFIHPASKLCLPKLPAACMLAFSFTLLAGEQVSNGHNSA